MDACGGGLVGKRFTGRGGEMQLLAERTQVYVCWGDGAVVMACGKSGVTAVGGVIGGGCSCDGVLEVRGGGVV